MASITGGYDCNFVETPPDKLICQICLLVVRSPHQVTCCGRVYCKACLDEHKKNSNTCPNCRKRGRKFPDTRGKTVCLSYLTTHIPPKFLPPYVGEQEIKSLRVMCSNSENGCGWVGELRFLDDHVTTCMYALILSCPNECNEEVRLLRYQLGHHLQRCPNRHYQCPHCNTTGRYHAITTTHLGICPRVKVPCPNMWCRVSLPRCELSKHRSSCQFEAVPCKYAEIGCNEVSLRKDLNQHENDAILHLNLAIETVNEQQKKMKVMEEKVVFSQAGPCVLKFPKYHYHKTSSQEWYSPPFYTHPGGYKMCIRVDADGFGEGTGTHVSVYTCLMQGRNDDTLPWPFTGEVTITLLNQLEDENHHTYTISFPQYRYNVASMRVVDDKRGSALGHNKFISQDNLDYDAAKYCQYLKDDCLYFQIEVEAAEPVKPWLTCTV